MKDFFGQTIRQTEIFSHYRVGLYSSLTPLSHRLEDMVLDRLLQDAHQPYQDPALSDELTTLLGHISPPIVCDLMYVT